MTRRTEIAFQNHIMDSYDECGGVAKKWASDWQKGNPDLICSLPSYGAHLAEVKHVPDFEQKARMANPLEKKQKQVCGLYSKSGALVMAYVVSGDKAINSKLYAFDPAQDVITPNHPVCVPYVLSKKYNVNLLVELFRKYYPYL